MAMMLPVCPVCEKGKGLVYAIIALSNCEVCESCFTKPLAPDVTVDSKEWHERARQLERKASRMMKKYL